MSTGGEVANALVCKTSIHGFDPHPVLHRFKKLRKNPKARQRLPPDAPESMSIAENHIDLGVAWHRRQRYKITSSLSGTGARKICPLPTPWP
jgi:hypothetical protein